jgi:hypothetical protein
MRDVVVRLDRLSRWWVPILLAGLTLAIYGSSVRFGLIWDDPIGYRRAAHQPFWQAFLGNPDYPFYRPLATLYAHSVVSSDDIVNAPLAHTLQLSVHLLVVLLSLPALQALGFEAWPARLTALLFAVFPFAYQAVAWQAPQQPWAMAGILAAIIAARVYLKQKNPWFLILSLLAYAAALLFQECALPFAGVFLWLAGRQWKADRAWHWWPLLHLGLATIYFLVWLSLPRQGGATGQGFQPVVLAYLLQGVIYPIVPWLTRWVANWPVLRLLALLAILGLGLALGGWRRGSRLAVMLSLGWIGAGFVPVWVGLGWAHVEIGSRLFYPAALGLAGLWGIALGQLVSARAKSVRAIGGVVLLAVMASSLWQLRQFQRLYEVGTEHLAKAVNTLSTAPGQRLVFANFPDRLELRSPVYVLGIWGVTLAPVIQNLSDYALAATGQSAADLSLASTTVGANDRGVWPYRVDQRGLDVTPEAFFQAAQQADMVYLTDYLPGGALRLRAVGYVRPAAAGPTAIAQIADFARLVKAEISEGDALTLRLTWQCQQAPLAGDTIFVHLWKEDSFVGGADGASLGGLVPLTAWLPGTDIIDLRRVELTGLEPGRYEVRAGIYNLASGARYPATAADGGLYPAEEITIGDVVVPIVR